MYYHSTKGAQMAEQKKSVEVTMRGIRRAARKKYTAEKMSTSRI